MLPDAVPALPDDVRVMSACGEQLGKIMQGKASALSILFPDDKDSDTSAEIFYNNTPLLWAGGRTMLKKILRETFRVWPELPEEERGVLRILEVGAGTGSSTKIFLEVLEEFGIKYQYTFTDISPAFFIKYVIDCTCIYFIIYILMTMIFFNSEHVYFLIHLGKKSTTKF